MPQKPRQAGFSLIELLIVVAVALIIAGLAVPNFMTGLRNYRIAGDRDAMNGEMLMAKMRASARNTQTRVRFNFTTRIFLVQWWNRATQVWVAETVGAPTRLSTGVDFGFGPVTIMPPAGSAVAIFMSGGCRNDTAVAVPGSGALIPNTACIVFNSRGYPINPATGNPQGGAVYIRNGNAVHGVTITAAGRSRLWRTQEGDTTGAQWLQR